MYSYILLYLFRNVTLRSWLICFVHVKYITLVRCGARLKINCWLVETDNAYSIFYYTRHNFSELHWCGYLRYTFSYIYRLASIVCRSFETVDCCWIKGSLIVNYGYRRINPGIKETSYRARGAKHLETNIRYT